MNSEILISLKPQFAEAIRTGKKNHEFRKYPMGGGVVKLWIYVTKPVAELKYVAQVGEVVTFRTQIIKEGMGNREFIKEGMGNREFNTGMKKAHYAFPIVHFDEIVPAIPLADLKKYGCMPPQSFMYLARFPLLVQRLGEKKINRIF